MNLGAAFDRWLARVRAVFTKRTLDADFADELTHHLTLQTEENIQSGMAPAEARRQAQLAIGGAEQLRELHRETRSLPWLEQSLQDLRYAVRMFRRERGFTVTALVILAVGIGLNTTVFSLVNTVLLRPLPFAEANRLVWITNADSPGADRALSAITSQIDTWEGLQATNHTLEQIEAYDPFSVLQTFRLTGGGGDPETISSVDVSPGLFGLLGVKPVLGRQFLPEDAAKNAPLRTIITNELWRRRFAADSHIIGRTVQINGEPIEVVGVLPSIDAFASVFFPALRVDSYSPLQNDQDRMRGDVVFMIARAKPQVALTAVAADLKLAVAQLKLQYPGRPDSDRYEANVTTVHEWVAGSLKSPLLFLWIAAGLVLAIVAFNLGGLLLARGLSRRKELALRCALGAVRGRVVRQLLMECLALVAAGSILGGLLAWGFIQFLSVHSSVEIPLLQTLRLDEAALVFTVLLCAITALLCGAVPAWKLTRGMDLQNALNEAGRSSTGGGQRSFTRNTLVILEVALACVLAISAGLMVRSLLNLLKTDLGFQPRDLIAVRIDPMIQGSQANYLETVLDRVRAVPGVESAGMTDCLPVERDRSWGVWTINPDKPKEQRGGGAHVRVISPGFFAAMGTTLFAGRDFTRMDGPDKPRALIINRTLAKWLWPTGESPIGHQLGLSFQDELFTVIGVVGDVRHSGPEIPSGGEMYLSMHQEISYSWDMMVRTRLPVATLTADLRNALHDVDASLPLTKVRNVQTLVDRTLSSRHLLVSLIGGFATIAIILAALGLYGVIAYMVSQQQKEIGIRLALGASPATVQLRIVQQTMRLASCGLILGVGCSLAANRLLQSLLYGVSANDGITYIVSLGTVLVCTVVAGYIPARRASRIDPIVALRAE